MLPKDHARRNAFNRHQPTSYKPAAQPLQELLLDEENLPITTNGVARSLEGVQLPKDINRAAFIQAIQRRLSIRYALALQPLEALRKWKRLGRITKELNTALLDPTLLSAIGPQKFFIGDRSISALEAMRSANFFLGYLAVELDRGVNFATQLRTSEFSKKHPRRLALWMIANLDRTVFGVAGVGDPESSRKVFEAISGDHDMSDFHRMRREYQSALRSSARKPPFRK